MKLFFLVFAILFSQMSLANLVIYSDRNPAWFSTAIADFKARTGQDVFIIEIGSKEIHGRLMAEGANTPADLIFSKDLMYVTEIVDSGLTQALPEIPAFQRIPTGMIPADRSYAAFTYRARAAIFNPNVISPDQLTTYEDLADPKWQGQLCVRSGTHDYNLSLVASMVLRNGAEQTENMVAGWMNNLAQEPYRKDSHMIQAVVDGDCGVAIINHYYLGQAMSANPDLPVAFSYLNQTQGGTHTNGTSVMMSRYSGKTELAEEFLKSLYTDASLLEISSNYFDYPASVDLRANTVVGDWGPNKDGRFIQEGLGWLEVGRKRSEAIQINTNTGWN